jgi:TRAP-type C4-dicarboxylate transport system permease small subunit
MNRDPSQGAAALPGSSGAGAAVATRPAPLERLNWTLHLLAAVWLFCLALLIMADIAGRALFSEPLSGTAEIVADSVVAMCFLQVSFAIRKGGMLRSELLDGWLSVRVARAIEVLGCLLGAGLFGLLAWSAYPSMVEAWTIGEYSGSAGGVKVPTAPARTVMVLMCVLASVNWLIYARERWMDVRPTGVSA